MLTARLVLILTFLFGLSLPARGESLKTEFDETCSKTDEAMSLPVAELNQLVDRCVQMRKRLEKEDETIQRVYAKRIEMCEGLYRFALQAKNKNDKEEAAK